MVAGRVTFAAGLTLSVTDAEVGGQAPLATMTLKVCATAARGKRHSRAKKENTCH